MGADESWVEKNHEQLTIWASISKFMFVSQSVTVKFAVLPTMKWANTA
jgi:hypothetical protein